MMSTDKDWPSAASASDRNWARAARLFGLIAGLPSLRPHVSSLRARGARHLPCMQVLTTAPSPGMQVLFAREERVHAVFSIEPHVVLQLGPAGICQERHRTSNAVFSRRLPQVRCVV